MIQAMKSFNKALLPYIILNIFVSAATTLGVILIWEAVRQARPPEIVGQAAPTQVAILPDATLPPLNESLITIETVFGAGDLKNETVRFVRQGQGDLMLYGWRVVDEDGNGYTFPNVNFITGAIELSTRSGSDTVIELFWGLDSAIWQSGETVKLLDPQGNLRSTYEIP